MARRRRGERLISVAERVRRMGGMFVMVTDDPLATKTTVRLAAARAGVRVRIQWARILTDDDELMKAVVVRRVL